MSAEPTTVIFHDDALLIAATAAGSIVKRAARGGTDAMTYDGVRDAILDAMAPSLPDET